MTCNDLNVSQALEITTADPMIKTELASNIVDNNLTVRQIRQIKQQLRPADGDFDAHARSKADQIIKKSGLVLKITLSRIDDLIEDAHSTSTRDRVELIKFLMDLRGKVHTMIDDSLRYKREKSRSR